MSSGYYVDCILALGENKVDCYSLSELIFNRYNELLVVLGEKRLLLLLLLSFPASFSIFDKLFILFWLLEVF